MRLLCPNCQRSIELADSDAGKTVACPICGQSFTTPQMYSAPVSPPPGYPPPAIPVAAPATPALTPPGNTLTPHVLITPGTEGTEPAAAPKASTSGAMPAGYTRFRSFPLTGWHTRWLPPIALTLAFLLSFFSWVGLYPGDYGAYVQNGWECLFGFMTSNPGAEEVLKWENGLNDKLEHHPSLWLIPYFLILIPCMILAWLVVLQESIGFQIPFYLRRQWARRHSVLAAAAVVLLLFLTLQWTVGFGLYHAAQDVVETQYSKEPQEPSNEVMKRKIKIGRDMGERNLRTTMWLRLSLLLHLLAATGIALDMAIAVRGKRPVPRIGIAV